MTQQRNLKKRIRARMAKTGESYSAARKQLLKHKPQRSTPAATDYATLAGMSNEAVERKTGMTWRQWCQALDKLHAQKLSHREIAKLVGKEWPQIGGWWAQSVTVGYERIRGLRAVGQRCDGDEFAASKSRTFSVPIDLLYRAVSQKRERDEWLDHDATVRSSRINKSVRFDWPDGTRVAVGFIDKGEHKSAITIEHTKLKNAAHRTREKDHWASRLDALRNHLRSR